MSILVVGSVAIDTIISPFGEACDVLGGSAIYFGLAARLFSPVDLVAVVGADFPPEYRALLENKGVDLAGLALGEGETFRWTGKYHDDINVRETLSLALNVFADFDPTVPEAYVNDEYVCLANIDPQLQAKVLANTKPKIVVSDTMDHWINSSREGLITLLKKVTIFILNDAEARLLTGEKNLTVAAKKIIGMGPGAVIIKKGEHGAIMYDGTTFFAASAYMVESVCDPTGAGDSFAGGFLGYLAETGKRDAATLRTAMMYGTALASFCVEKFGVDRLCEIIRADVDGRVKALKEMTCFSLYESTQSKK